MSTYISAKDYKKITGLKTKIEGMYLAKRYDVKTNRKIKDQNRRYRDFLSRLKDKIRENDIEKIEKYNRNKHLLKFLKGETDRIDINYDDLIKKIRVKVNGREYIREAMAEINKKFIYDTVKNINQKDGKLLMAKIGYISPDSEEVSYKYYVINQNFLDSLREEENEGDYYNEIFQEKFIVSFSVYYKNKTNKNRRLEGGFFKYVTINNKYLKKISDKLERYQIYTDLDIDNLNEDENCLIHSLRLSGVEEKLLEELKLKCRSFVIPLTEVKKFAEKNSLTIMISGDKHNYSYKYAKDDKVIKICLIEDHYFINEDVEISSYSIENFNEVCKEDKWWKITGTTKVNGKTYFRREKAKNNNSFRLIKKMLENGFFNELNINEKTLGLPQYNKLNDEVIDLNNSSNFWIDEKRSSKPEPFYLIQTKGHYKKMNRTKEEYYDLKENEFIDYDKYEIKSKLSRFSEIIKQNMGIMIQLLKGDEYNKFINKIEKYIKEGQHEFIIPFDFETTTDTEKHRPYMICFDIYFRSEKLLKNKMCYTGSDCAVSFLNFINVAINKKMDEMGLSIFNKKDKRQRKIRSQIVNLIFKNTIMAHNITYDIQFLMKYVSDYTPVFRSSNKVCGGNFRYYGVNYNIKDTYAILDCPLAKFKEVFGIEMEKEVFPYELYNEKNVVAQMCKISDAIKYLKSEEDINKFKSNIEKLDLKIDNEYFNHIKYARYYCERDVEVMMKGYLIFKDWVKTKLEGIDIDNFLTISSISDQYFKRTKCYDGCYYINGVARYFIQKTVVGGRCMSNKNQKYLLNEKLNDFDGVSLYPSAMKRLAEIGGYLKGQPKVIPKDMLNLKDLNKVDGYFIRIKLNKVRTKRDFPLISHVNKEGVRMFTDEINDENNIMYMNKISLEDLIEFHGVKEKDFEILDGYYFNEGRNQNIGKTIEYVFNIRLKYKKEGNPVQNLFKLVMNSAYGKTIMKEQSDKIMFFDSKFELQSKISKDHNHVVEFEKLKECDKYLLKIKKPINDHYNACHIGSEILAMSKRIMNEVMCLAEDKDIKIYYQDTDSMHIENDKIETLAKEFKKKYNRDLIGKSLGQFHCDFEPKFQNGKLNDALYSKKTIILGKKAYIDLVQYENKVEGFHYRMKGIPQSIIKLKADKDFGGDIFKLYEHLYEGSPIEFDLLSDKKPRFQINNKGLVTNAVKFSRTLKFGEEEQDNFEEDYDKIFNNIED